MASGARYVINSQVLYSLAPPDYALVSTGGSAVYAGGSPFHFFGLLEPTYYWFEGVCVAATVIGTTDPPVPPPDKIPADVYAREHYSKDFKMIRGDTLSFDSQAIDQDRVPVNLTGATLRMTAKYRYTDADAAAVFTFLSTGVQILVTAPLTGLFTTEILPANTTGLPAHRVDLYYDVQAYWSATGVVHTLLYGRLTVVPDVGITVP